MELLVCPLSELAAVIASRKPSHLVSLLSPGEMIETPDPIAPGRHLQIELNDITELSEGLTAPAAHHAKAIITFARRWDRAAPMAIHCYAGISRSTAAALLAHCALDPAINVRILVRALRDTAPFAVPNRLLVAHGDQRLGLGGRLLAAVDAMAPAVMAPQGRLFSLGLAPSAPSP